MRASNTDNTRKVESLVEIAERLGATSDEIRIALTSLEGSNTDTRKINGLMKLIANKTAAGGGGNGGGASYWADLEGKPFEINYTPFRPIYEWSNIETEFIEELGFAGNQVVMEWFDDIGGTPFIVDYDGVLYYVVSTNEYNGWSLGNREYMSIYNDLDEHFVSDLPFAFSFRESYLDAGKAQVVVIMTKDGGIHNIKIYRYCAFTETLDTRYLPHLYPKVQFDQQVLLDKVTYTTTEDNQSLPVNNKEGLTDGRLYRVIVNGQTFDAVCSTSYGNLWFGDVYAGDPCAFWLGPDDSGRNTMEVTFGKAGTYEVTLIEFVEKAVVPMSELFMPILTAPNGNKYKIVVDDEGNLSTQRANNF